MRRDLFSSIISQEIAFFDQAQTGEILSRLISDCEVNLTFKFFFFQFIFKDNVSNNIYKC